MSSRSLVANHLWNRVLQYWKDGEVDQARHAETYYGFVDAMGDEEFECIEGRVIEEKAPVS